MTVAGAFARVPHRCAEIERWKWYGCDGGLALGLTANGRQAVGASALAVSSDRTNRTQADIGVLEAVGGECLRDLQSRAAVAFGLSSQSVWDKTDIEFVQASGHRLEIAGPAGCPPLSLFLSEDLFIRTVRAKLPLASRSAPFRPALEALASLPVTLSAALGCCGITIAELENLAVGDVLIFDRAVDARLPLAIDGATAPNGACTLAQRDGHLALEIMEALSA